MKYPVRPSKIFTWLVSFFLAFQFCVGFPFGRGAHAQINQNQLASSVAEREGDGFIGNKLSSDLEDLIHNPASVDDRVRVIVQTDALGNGEIPTKLRHILRRNGINLKARLRHLDSIVVELPLSDVDDLAASEETSYISIDRGVEMLGHLQETTGTDDMSKLSGNKDLDGTGIGIAVLDSGIDTGHYTFRCEDDGGNQQNGRVVARVDFVGEGITTTDPYGHGTHVAGLAAGNIEDKYEGIAPNANLINLRVLDASGRGTVSGVLSALDWVMGNRGAYNIRVVNMSLGAFAVDSYVNDPVCRAVRRLVNAGVVVVAAAGNNGKDSNGQKIYGLIHSPGNEPSAITVGATNTYGTDIRDDDTVTTYSSRGPTRSYWTDSNGERHFDNLIKPDLVAPGNRLISAESDNCALITLHPELATNKTGTNKAMMYLSGTSMSAPVVAGTVALMLQANPNLTPNLVKAILMYTAQPLAGYNMLEQGAGELNVEGAIRLAKLVRTNLTSSTALGSPLLITNDLPSPQSRIVGRLYLWSQGIILGYTYATGTDLIAKYQAIYGVGFLLSDGHLLSNAHLLSNTTMLTNGIALGDNILTSDGHLLSNGNAFLSVGVLIGDAHLLSNGFPLGDGLLLSDAHLLSNSYLLSDAQTQADIAQLAGDPGGMQF